MITDGNAATGQLLTALPIEESTQRLLFVDTDSEKPGTVKSSHVSLEMCNVGELRPHPRLVEFSHLPGENRLLELEKVGDALFEQPLLITQENIIVDGLARWSIARRQNRVTVLCQRCQLNENETLQRILELQNTERSLSVFCRVELAIGLGKFLREKALANQIAGGKCKGLAKLTEAGKHNCRQEMARLAGTGFTTVGKVVKLHKTACPTLLIAARNGEVSIHYAWKLSQLPRAEQESELAGKRIKRRTQMRMRQWLRKTKDELTSTIIRDLSDSVKALKGLSFHSDTWQKIDDLLAAIDKELSNGGRIINEKAI